MKSLNVENIEKYGFSFPRDERSFYTDLFEEDPSPKLTSVDLQKFTTSDGETKNYYLYNYVSCGRSADVELVALFHHRSGKVFQDEWVIDVPTDVGHDFTETMPETACSFVQLYLIGYEHHGPICTFHSKITAVGKVSKRYQLVVPRTIPRFDFFDYVTVCVTGNGVCDDSLNGFVYPSYIGEMDLFGVHEALCGKW